MMHKMGKSSQGFAAVLCFAFCVQLEYVETARNSPSNQNSRPLVGVLTQPLKHSNYSYVAASYIKFIEASGGQVVPLQCNLPVKELRARFELVNGLLIPGGAAPLSPKSCFYDAAKVLVGFARTANTEGDYFPVHGTCLGMEALVVIFSGLQSSEVLSKYDSYNFPSSVTLTEEATNSSFFKSLTPLVLQNLQSENITMENHGRGLSYDTYQKVDGLHKEFIVTSFSSDRKGAWYVASMESNKMPLTATQWHPEKNAFEWEPQLNIPHSSNAVEVTHAVSNFIVNEARKNGHRIDTAKATNLSINNYPLLFTGKVRSQGKRADFDEIYIFNANGMESSRRVGEIGSINNIDIDNSDVGDYDV